LEKINLGIVGLGAITQMVYLPDLEMLRDKYAVKAVCDASPGVLDAVGSKLPQASRYLDSKELCKSGEIDAVLIANSDGFHYADAMEAIKNGKHVFIEKPMCFTKEEAEDIRAEAKKRGVRAMIGYVRRYSDAYKSARRELEDIKGSLHYVRIRDILGYNFLFMKENSGLFRFDDIPGEVAKEGARKSAESQAKALGERHAGREGFYGYLAGLCCHDFSAMRGLLGFPKKIVSAYISNGGSGLYLSVVFDYGSFAAAYESGIDSQKRRDSTLEFFSEKKTVKLEYNCFYYLKQLPDTVTVDETVGGEHGRRIVTPSYFCPYARELEAFYDAVTFGAPIETPPEDYEQDIELFKMILDKL